MKNINLFETKTAYESASLVYPNLSLTKDDGNVISVLEEPPIFVDLGLPSGTLWMDRNLGASNPEDYGLFYPFGSNVGYSIEDAKKLTTYPSLLPDYNTMNKYKTDGFIKQINWPLLYVRPSHYATVADGGQWVELFENTNISETATHYVFQNKKDKTKSITIPKNGYINLTNNWISYNEDYKTYHFLYWLPTYYYDDNSYSFCINFVNLYTKEYVNLYDDNAKNFCNIRLCTIINDSED